MKDGTANYNRAGGFNRYIVECKLDPIYNRIIINTDLIDT